MRSLFYRFFYRSLMRFAHRLNWHYAPPIYPDGDTVLRCSWCGFQQMVRSNPPRIAEAIERVLAGGQEHPAVYKTATGKLVAGKKYDAHARK